jgi:hypothetical protein
MWTMPYQLTAEAMFLRLVFVDTITPDDLMHLADALATIDGSSLITPNRLVDLSQVRGRHLSYTDMIAFEQRQTQPLSTRVKLTVVAPRTEQRIFAQMFQVFTSHPQIEFQIFAALDEAEAWLTSP